VPKRSVSTKGLFISVIIAILLIVGSVFGINSRSATANQPNHFTIDMTDYEFTPNTMTWHVGNIVTLTVKNDSQSIAGTNHEFMIGRNPNTGNEGFGKTITDGFETDFFDKMNVKILSGSRVLMVQPGTAHLTGINPKKTLASYPPGLVQQGDAFQIVIAPPIHGANPKPGGTITFQIKVPNELGKWEMGCFQGNGEHIKDGMLGTINIVK
jgi:hypothetical protein